MQPLGRRKQLQRPAKRNFSFGKLLCNWWEDEIPPYKVREKREADKLMKEEIFSDPIDIPNE